MPRKVYINNEEVDYILDDLTKGIKLDNNKIFNFESKLK